MKSVTYTAAGQVRREEQGNGVVVTYTYEPQTQRLTGVRAERPAGHRSGQKVLQDLRYGYDPVGNVVSVRNDAEATRYWRNQKVEAVSGYDYDSLYRLVSATGREMADAGREGGGLPQWALLHTAGGAYTNYTRRYRYDTGGNLTQIRHSGAATENRWTRDITVSDRSNRGVMSSLTADAGEVDGLFTAGGQQTQLQAGQGLEWTERNELLSVSPVVREGGTGDRESYRYDGSSQRVLKVSEQRTGGGVRRERVMYLPGLEVRTKGEGGAETERLETVVCGGVARTGVRVLHWETGLPSGLSNDGVRYSCGNLTGSGELEADGEGELISQEEYYPYGGTAVWAVRSELEGEYKTVRYSGKERDATGLYYYGYRYYQAWTGRWLSADPAGTVDGLNLYRMCRNNP
ncbi:RHS repeat-associated core domain-containing protein, partial [Enterobacter ludwigii]